MTKKLYFVTSAMAVALAIGGCSKAKESAAIPNDAQLAVQVQQRIGADSALSGSAITVNANSGVVTLTGHVQNEAELRVALADVQQVEGVKQVVSRVDVAEAVAQTAPPAPAQAVEQPAPVAKRSPVRHRELASSQSRVFPSTSSSPSPAVQPYTPAPSTNPSTSSLTPPADVAPTPVVDKTPQKITVPAGTPLQVRLNDRLSSETSRPNQSFRGTLSSDVVVDEYTVIPAGADVEGQVVDAQSSTHYAGSSLLSLQLTKISYNGMSYNVATDQWTRKGEARGKSTATKVATGAGIGAVLGGIFGGGKGAAIGATAGAGAGAGANTISKGKPVDLGPESLVNFRLTSPVTMKPVGDSYMRHGPAMSPQTSEDTGAPRLKHGPVLRPDSDPNNDNNNN